MLKCKITKDKRISVNVSGTPHDLALETSCLVAEIYNGLREDNQAAADEFKRTVLTCLIAPGSPVWKED